MSEVDLLVGRDGGLGRGRCQVRCFASSGLRRNQEGGGEKEGKAQVK